MYTHMNEYMYGGMYVCLHVHTYICVYVYIYTNKGVLRQAEVYIYIYIYIYISKGVPRQAEVALGVPGRLRSRIISMFGTTRVVDRQPYAPATFTPGKIPSTHFQRLSRPQGTWFCRKEPRKKSPVTRSRDRPTSSAAP